MGICHTEIPDEILERIAKLTGRGVPRCHKESVVRSAIREILPHDHLTDSEVRYVLQKVREFKKVKAKKKACKSSKKTAQKAEKTKIFTIENWMIKDSLGVCSARRDFMLDDP